MVAAGVVVANPILVPRADVQIPAVALSAGTADNMLDKSFLDAIAPAAPESNGPFSVLKQLVSALAADATYLGKNAIVEAFVAGVGAVSGPDLGTVNNTYVAPPAPPAAPVVSLPPDLSTLVPVLAPHLDVSVLSAANIPTDIVNATSAYADASVVPVVAQAFSAIAHDATYIGNNVLTAAYAVGAAVAAEPGLIGDTLTALVHGDINAALESAVKAVVKVVETPFTSSLQVINAIKNVIETHLKELVAIFIPAAPVDVPATSAPSVSTPSAGDGTDLPSVPAPGGRRPRSGDIPVLVSGRVTAPHASAVAAVSPRAAAALPAFSTVVSTPRVAAGAVRDAVRSLGEQVGSLAGQAAGNPAGPVGKAGARARAAAAAR